jgi:hypothetical protein
VVGQVRASTGILFGTDTAAANALDDYEEGTWTPTIVGGTTTGTVTYGTRTGTYRKVGSIVTVSYYINWSSHTGTGQMRLAGLPFNENLNQHNAQPVIFESGITLPANTVYVSGWVFNTTNYIIFTANKDNALISVVEVSASGTIFGTATYMAA